ncbi:MAG TPA: symmetrical bis(5'-nucleosyl)-tetraphosphatase [Nevskiales bacterium]|nr:symmetrical bis(5'-nucleosyl)-tetraphosphatase [Nevskiales bacterium]
MPLYAIGDVQGCLAELLQLLERLRFSPDRDRLWFTGDLVNRGPDSLGTLRFVRSLGSAAVTVLGNHDLHLLAVAADPQRRRRTDDSLDAVLQAPDRDELLDWLRRQPLLHHDPERAVTMVHAGLPPEWDLAAAQACAREVETVLRAGDGTAFFGHMYGDQPRRWDPALTGWPRLRFIVNCLTRLRYCTPDGRLALEHKGAPDGQRDDVQPWFRLPGRRSRGQRIVFGHWSTLGQVAWDDERVWGLDSGCVWGGRLSALRLDTEPWELTQLPCPPYCRPVVD